MKNKLFVIILFCSSCLFSQYTETINSNRPGTSHGAFSVGRDVLQFEVGLKNYSLTHSNLNNSKINGLSSSYNVRYGLYLENLEIFLKGSYNYNDIIDYIMSEIKKHRKPKKLNTIDSILKFVSKVNNYYKTNV